MNTQRLFLFKRLIKIIFLENRKETHIIQNAKMIKKYLNYSRKYLLEHRKFVWLSFVVWFCRFFYIVFFLAYNVNTLLTYKLEKGLSIFTIFQLFVDLVNENNLLRLVIIVLILFAIWYAFGYPIWISANIHFLQKDENENIWSALSEWIKDFFSVFELNGLAFSFWAYTYFSTLFRLYILDVLDSGLAITLIILWWICVLFSSIFRQYAKYILVLEKNDWKNIWVSEALKKSMNLTITNFGLTFKWFLAKAWMTIVFYFKIAIIVTIPLLLIYFFATSDVIWPNSQRIIWVMWVLTMVIATFMLTSTQAFFFKFWHLIYQKVKENG